MAQEFVAVYSPYTHHSAKFQFNNALMCIKGIDMNKSAKHSQLLSKVWFALKYK